MTHSLLLARFRSQKTVCAFFDRILSCAPEPSVKCTGSVSGYRERETHTHIPRDTKRWSGWMAGLWGRGSYGMYGRASNETGMSICVRSGIPKRRAESRHTRTQSPSLEVAFVRLTFVCVCVPQAPTSAVLRAQWRRYPAITHRDPRLSLGTLQGQDTISLSSQM